MSFYYSVALDSINMPPSVIGDQDLVREEEMCHTNSARVQGAIEKSWTLRAHAPAKSWHRDLLMNFSVGQDEM